MSSSEKVSDQKTPGPTWTDAEPYFKIRPEDIRPPATPEEIAEATADLLRRPFRVIQAEKVSALETDGKLLAELASQMQTKIIVSPTFARYLWNASPAQRLFQQNEKPPRPVKRVAIARALRNLSETRRKCQP